MSESTPAFGSLESTLRHYDARRLERAQQLRAEVFRMPEFQGFPDTAQEAIFWIFADEARSLDTGIPAKPASAAEERMRATFRRVTEAMPREHRRAWLASVEPLLEQGPPPEVNFRIVEDDGRPRLHRCAGCGRVLDGPVDEEEMCAHCAASVESPDFTQAEFDQELERLGGGNSGLFARLLEFIGQFVGVPKSTTCWAELDRLEEVPLRDTRYWNLTDPERAELTRRWVRLGTQPTRRPNKRDRYELASIFGSAKRAKIFYAWVRIATRARHTDAWRWIRCPGCGGDLPFPAFSIGQEPCPDCGTLTDKTIYGDEAFLGNYFPNHHDPGYPNVDISAPSANSVSWPDGGLLRS